MDRNRREQSQHQTNRRNAVQKEGRSTRSTCLRTARSDADDWRRWSFVPKPPLIVWASQVPECKEHVLINMKPHQLPRHDATVLTHLPGDLVSALLHARVSAMSSGLLISAPAQQDVHTLRPASIETGTNMGADGPCRTAGPAACPSAHCSFEIYVCIFP